MASMNPSVVASHVRMGMLTGSCKSPKEQGRLCCSENPSSKCDVSCNV